MNLLDIPTGCGLALKTNSNEYMQGNIMYVDSNGLILNNLVKWQQDTNDYCEVNRVRYFDLNDIADYTRIAPFIGRQECVRNRSRPAVDLVPPASLPQNAVQQNQSQSNFAPQYSTYPPQFAPPYVPPDMLPLANVVANTPTYHSIPLSHQYGHQVPSAQYVLMEPVQHRPPTPVVPFAERQYYLQSQSNVPTQYYSVPSQRAQINSNVVNYNGRPLIYSNLQLTQIRDFIDLNNITDTDTSTWYVGHSVDTNNSNITSDLTSETTVVESNSSNEIVISSIPTAIDEEEKDQDNNIVNLNSDIVTSNTTVGNDELPSYDDSSLPVVASTSSLAQLNDFNEASTPLSKKKKRLRKNNSGMPSTSNSNRYDNHAFITEKEVLVPSISLSARYEIQTKLASNGVALTQQSILFGQRITDLILTMLRTCFIPRRNVMNATGAILCARNESAYDLALNVVLCLATNGFNTFLHISKKSNYDTANTFEMHRHYRHFQVFTERCRLMRNVRYIPRADFVVLMMQANHNERWTSEVLAWINRITAPVLVVDPPINFDFRSRNKRKYAVIPILPITGFRVQKYLQVFLCDLNVPRSLLREYVGEESNFYDYESYSVLKYISEHNVINN